MTAAVVSLAIALAASIGVAVAMLMLARRETEKAAAAVRKQDAVIRELADVGVRLIAMQRDVEKLSRNNHALRNENVSLLQRVANYVKAVADSGSPADLVALGDKLFAYNVTSGVVDNGADAGAFADTQVTPPMSPAAMARAASVRGEGT